MVSVRHVGTIRGRIREDAPGAGAVLARVAASRSTLLNRYDLLFSAVAPCRKVFATNGSGIFNCQPRKLSGLTVEKSFLSVKSGESVVHFLWSRLAALNSFAFAPGFAPAMPIPQCSQHRKTGCFCAFCAFFRQIIGSSFP